MAIIKHKKILIILILVAIFISISYSFLYWLLVHINATSFYGLGKESNVIDYLYFSLTTMTGSGFGDILPLTAITKIIVVSEVIVGIIIIGFIIYFSSIRIPFKKND